jgi:hypothetical protein
MPCTRTRTLMCPNPPQPPSLLAFFTAAQDQLGRAEGYNIVHADHQYCVPTDGKPIRGLIQDHVVAGL